MTENANQMTSKSQTYLILKNTAPVSYTHL